MLLRIRHNQETKVFKNKNLIFFAKSSSNPQAESTDKLDSAATLAAIEAQQNLKAPERNRIKDLLADSTRAEKPPFSDYLLALRKGHILDKELEYLDALEKKKETEEYKFAQKTVRDAAKSKPSKGKHQQNLTTLRTHRTLEADEEGDISTSTRKKIKKGARLKDESEKILSDVKKEFKETALHYKVWQPEDAPKKLTETMGQLFKDYSKVISKMTSVDQKMKKAYDAWKKADAAGNDKEAQRHLEEAGKHRVEICRLRYQDLKSAAKKLRQPEWVALVTKRLKQYRSIKDLSRKLGIDLLSSEEIVIWLLGKKTEGIPIEIRTHGKKTIVEVHEISFEPHKTDSAEPGEGQIKYTTDQDGTNTTSFKNFSKFLDDNFAHEKAPESADKEDMEKFLRLKLGYNVKEGDRFIQGEEIFHIEKIERKGDEWIIILDKKVTYTNQANLSPGHPIGGNYQEKNFTLGQFVSFIRKNKVERKFKNVQNFNLALQITKQNLDREREHFVLGENQKIRELYGQLHGLPDRNSLSPEELKQAEMMLGNVPDALEEVPEVGASMEVEMQLKNGTTALVTISTHKDEDGYIYLNYDIPKEDTQGWKIPPESIASIFGSVERDNKGNVQLPNATRTISGGNRIHGVPPTLHQELTGNGSINKVKKPDAPATPKPPKKRKSKDKEKDKEGKEKKVKTLGPPDYDELALPYEEVYKAGGMKPVEASMIRSFWLNTRVLSLDDFWEMGKTIWEYVKRKLERDQKERYASIGEHLPWVSPEMKRIKQTAESEEVSQFQQGLEQEGIDDIQDRLRSTRNKDELKACFTVLSQKGQLRWDDLKMWEQLNRWVDPSVQKKMPIPGNGDPYTRIAPGVEKTGFDYLEPVIDHIWGAGTYNDWYRQNNSNTESNMKSFYDRGGELALIPGGHERDLRDLLSRHKRGEWIDPHKYEGLISHAIEVGKSSIQVKIYYLVQGITATNPDGRTILSYDRMAAVAGRFINNYPLFDYLAGSVMRENGESHSFTLDDYRNMAKRWNSKDTIRNACIPNAEVDKDIWNHILPAKAAQIRIRKALKDPQLDHEDIPYFLPSATESQVTDLTKNFAGARRFLSVEAFANAYPGFAQYMTVLAKTDRIDQLMESITSYFRYDNILSDRWEKGKDGFYRMDDASFERGPIMGAPGLSTRNYQEQMNGMILNLAKHYAQYNPELQRVVKYIGISKDEVDAADKADLQKQYTNFGKNLKIALKREGEMSLQRSGGTTDNRGQAMTQIVKGQKLTPMAFKPSKDKDSLALAREAG